MSNPTLNLALPGNPRYQPKILQGIFGYDYLYKGVAEVEIATMRTLAEIGIIPPEVIAHLTTEVEARLLNITTSQVDEVERAVTKHDIRAWVRIAQGIVGPELKPWVHVSLTSYDVLDTGRILLFVRAHAVVTELTDSLIGHLCVLTKKYADVVQIGRTHGQHALPITVGFWLATILSRLLANIESANSAAEKLVGKISGAVGAYNAQVGLGIAARCGDKSLEERVLAKLGLKPARISTQILPPEPLADYLFACAKISLAIDQLGRDARNLMRTEIGELCEPFTQGQVGSSTMAHKRNPINFENLEGTGIRSQVEFGKVFATMVSDHQRDLVGSSIARDFPTILVNLVSQLNVLLREADGKPFILRIAVDETACARNFAIQGDLILAEPLYLALQMAGYAGDAHEFVNRKAVPFAQANSMSLLDALEALIGTGNHENVRMAWENVPHATKSILKDPKAYIGAANTKALEVVKAAEIYLERWMLTE